VVRRCRTRRRLIGVPDPRPTFPGMRPFLSTDALARSAVAVDRELLADVLGLLATVTIREALIPHRSKLVFGEHDRADGSITLATPLARVATYLHEATHHARPDWPEPQVQAAGEALLRSVTYREIATLNRRLLRKIAERP
jgi:hypothetical protein